MGGSAILLAAGKSTRMGSLKGLLPWHGTTLFEHQLKALERASLDEIIVVLGFQAELFNRIAKNYPIKIVYNQHFLSGKCSSILCGLQAIEKVSLPILITAVDQPTNPEIINRLAESLQNSNAQIAVPVYKEKRGHPVLFSERMLSELLSITEETQGLRGIFQKYKHNVLEVPVNNSGILLNLNTYEDYEKIVRN